MWKRHKWDIAVMQTECFFCKWERNEWCREYSLICSPQNLAIASTPANQPPWCCEQKSTMAVEKESWEWSFQPDHRDLEITTQNIWTLFNVFLRQLKIKTTHNWYKMLGGLLIESDLESMPSVNHEWMSSKILTVVFEMTEVWTSSYTDRISFCGYGVRPLGRYWHTKTQRRDAIEMLQDSP